MSIHQPFRFKGLLAVKTSLPNFYCYVCKDILKCCLFFSDQLLHSISKSSCGHFEQIAEFSISSCCQIWSPKTVDYGGCNIFSNLGKKLNTAQFQIIMGTLISMGDVHFSVLTLIYKRKNRPMHLC